jgi:nicotinamide mononucleotide (NMN) deamidase PncC
LQGFLLEKDNKMYIFLPNDEQVIDYIFKYYINPIFVRKNKKIYNNFIYKTLGLSKNKIESELRELLNTNHFIYKVSEEDLDGTIVIRYLDSIDNELLSKTTSAVYERFSKYIYSLEDCSIFKTACDLLNLSNENISIAENLTKGNITKKLSDYDTKSKIFSSTIFTSLDSISRNFDVAENLLDESAFSNVELVYEIASSMLEKNNTNLVLCSMGEMTKDNENVLTATNFIAVGDMDGIHVYKNIFTGGYNSIVESITKTSIFYLIKKIKRNDLLFSQSTI